MSIFGRKQTIICGKCGTENRFKVISIDELEKRGAIWKCKNCAAAINRVEMVQE